MNTTNYSKLDHPLINQFLFHPRKSNQSSNDSDLINYLIPIDDTVQIGAKLHMKDHQFPTILFFHGNGEIASDYDDLASEYHQVGLNFIPVDYRGYGTSTGSPSASTMIKDAHAIFTHIRNWLDKEGYTGSLIIMGRSLGSASALEIAFSYSQQYKGLIIESGFANTIPLLRRLGISTEALSLTEDDGFRNIQKIQSVVSPTLILHARHDQIIPIEDAELLQSFSGARNKQLQIVPHADHNTIIMVAGKLYFTEIKKFVDKIDGKREKRFFRKKVTP